MELLFSHPNKSHTKGSRLSSTPAAQLVSIRHEISNEHHNLPAINTGDSSIEETKVRSKISEITLGKAPIKKAKGVGKRINRSITNSNASECHSKSQGKVHNNRVQMKREIWNKSRVNFLIFHKF